ncbi:MAG: hypothetical protein JWP69_809 [Flaviaesturariibacter sp.]|nr:hypothetical protein [Flaviaesturariibacter sp.]
MIAVRPTPFATEYKITMVHDDLLDELPSQKILHTSTGQFAFVNHTLDQPTLLMQVILKALEEYLAASV